MTLKVTKETEDARGNIVWLSSNDKQMHIVEIKKGYARGGHYHPFASVHIIISGKVTYKENDLKGSETENQFGSNSIITTPANIAHLMIALEDTIFIEIFDPPYNACEFPPYRRIVEQKKLSSGEPESGC